MIGSDVFRAGGRLAKAEGRRPDALPAGLVGFSSGRRLQKLSSAPRALARLQFCVGKYANTHTHQDMRNAYFFCIRLSFEYYSNMLI